MNCQCKVKKRARFDAAAYIHESAWTKESVQTVAVVQKTHAAVKFWIHKKDSLKVHKIFSTDAGAGYSSRTFEPCARVERLNWALEPGT